MEKQMEEFVVVESPNGEFKILSPAHPQPCTHVRLTHQGKEMAYWASAEWQEDPMDTMGAILGAIKAVALGEQEKLVAIRLLLRVDPRLNRSR